MSLVKMSCRSRRVPPAEAPSFFSTDGMRSISRFTSPRRTEGTRARSSGESGLAWYSLKPAASRRTLSFCSLCEPRLEGSQRGRGLPLLASLLVGVGTDDERHPVGVLEQPLPDHRLEVAAAGRDPGLELLHRRGESQGVDGVHAVRPPPQAPAHQAQRIGLAVAADLAVPELDPVDHGLHEPGVETLVGEVREGLQDESLDSVFLRGISPPQPCREDHLPEVGLQAGGRRKVLAKTRNLSALFEAAIPRFRSGPQKGPRETGERGGW